MARRQKNPTIKYTIKVINGDIDLKKIGYMQRLKSNDMIKKKVILDASLLLYFSHPSITPPIITPKIKNESPHKKYITPRDNALLGKM